MSEVLDFNKASQRLTKQLEKGKTPTKKAALNAMVENNQLMQGLFQTINRLASTQMQLEKFIQQVDTNLRVLGKTLTDKKVFADEDFEKTWFEMVEKPKEDALKKHIDTLKGGAAEDAFYGAVLEQVQKFAFADEERSGQRVSGLELRNFFINMMANPQTRAQTLPDLRLRITDLPEFDPSVLPERPVLRGADDTETDSEVRTMPDCRYCGKPDCEFCSKLVVSEPVSEAPSSTPEALEPTSETLGGHESPECCGEHGDECCNGEEACNHE